MSKIDRIVEKQLEEVFNAGTMNLLKKMGLSNFLTDLSYFAINMSKSDRYDQQDAWKTLSNMIKDASMFVDRNNLDV